MIRIVAVLCSLSAPTDCHDATVATSDTSDITLQSCMMGAPQLADWMNREHPAERLASWKCIVGKAPEHA
jgi:hypothetical protein